MFGCSRKLDNRSRLINAKLWKVLPQFTDLYAQLKSFVTSLEEQGTLTDHNLSTYLQAYTPNKYVHLRTGELIEEPILNFDMHYSQAYIENECIYTDWWHSSANFETHRGLLSPFWRDMIDYNPNARFILKKDLSTIEHIKIGVRVDYQVPVKLNFTWDSKLSKDDKLNLLNNQLFIAEKKIFALLNEEREMCELLQQQRIIDQNDIKQYVKLYTRSRAVNQSCCVTIGNPFFEKSMDWRSLLNFGLGKKYWTEDTFNYCSQQIKNNRTYTLFLLQNNFPTSNKNLFHTDTIYMQFSVDYAISLFI